MSLDYSIKKMRPVYRGKSISCDRWSTKGQLGEILLLHGGGTSSKAGFERFRQVLIALGFGSLSLDYIGHGETGGTLHGYTLRDRLNQTKILIKYAYKSNKRLNIIGFSMGAYIATLLTQEFKVEKLGLIIPAMYHCDAFDIPFGPEFSQKIRAEYSWVDSDGFEIIRSYEGKLLIASAENDHIIPNLIPHKLYCNSVLSQWKYHHIISEAGHELGSLAHASPKIRFQLLQGILHWLSF